MVCLVDGEQGLWGGTQKGGTHGFLAIERLVAVQLAHYSSLQAGFCPVCWGFQREVLFHPVFKEPMVELWQTES